MDRENSLTILSGILKQAIEQGASDVHLTADMQVMMRIDGELVPMPECRMAAGEIEQLVGIMLTGAQNKAFAQAGEFDFGYTVTGVCRLRGNVFLQGGALAVILRLLPFEIPSPEQLGIPEAVVGLAQKRQGLVLITGPAGCGKSTTLAALIGVIAEQYTKSILTLENPVEYLYPQKKSVVLQREIGTDSRSSVAALRAALRQDPDVIMVEQLRGAEMLEAAIEAAESGHLVLSTLPSAGVEAAVARLIHMFKEQPGQMKERLAEALAGVVSQRLLPRVDGGGRVAAFEILLADPAARSLLREGKTYQIPSILHGGYKKGMRAMDDDIYDLYMRSAVSAETAIRCAQDPEGMQQKVQLF